MTGKVKNMNRGAKKMQWWQWLCMQDELVLEPSAVGTIAEHAPLLYKNNKSGVTGVGWHKNARQWRARITVNGECRHLGYFRTLEEAAKARRLAEG